MHAVQLSDYRIIRYAPYPLLAAVDYEYSRTYS